MSAASHTTGQQLFDLFSSSISEHAICMLDCDGIISFWNEGAANFYKYLAGEIVGQPVALLLKGLSIKQNLEQAFSNGSSNVEITVCRKDGWQFPGFATFKPLYQNSTLQGYALIVDSLTYTRKMEYRFNHPVQNSETKGLFQQLIEHSYSGITLFDADFNFIYRNPAAARITGFNDNARADTSFAEIVHPADRVRVKNTLDILLQTPGCSLPCNLRSRHFEGHFIELEGVFTNWLQEPEIRAIVLNFHDVTEKHKKEETLKQAFTELSDYKQALDASAIVAITDQRGVIKHVNDNFCKISGYSKDELIGQDHRIVNSTFHDKAFMKNLWRTIAAGNVWKGDICNRRKDGDIYWVATTIVPFLNDKGKPYRYVAIRFDRTEGKMIKKELIEKNEQISSLLESINDGFIGVDHDLRYNYVNKRTCEIVGLLPEEMIGKTMWELFPDVVGTPTWHAIEEARITGQPVTNEDYYAPFDLWQENRIYPTANGLSIFISDIGWRKREEQQKALLADISQIFNQMEPPPLLLQQVMKKVLALSSCFCLAETWLVNRDLKHIKLASQAAADERYNLFFEDHPHMRQLDKGNGLPGITWMNGNVEFWPDLANRKDFLRREAATKAQLISALGVPLRYNGNVIGVLLIGLTGNERPGYMDDGTLNRLGDYLGTTITRRQLENEVRDIFEAASDIICIVGMDRQFKKVNPAMCRMLGYTEAELLNMTVDDFVHPDDRPESKKRMELFKNESFRSVYFENRYITRSGAVINLAWTAARGNEEDVMFSIGKNITDKKKAEEEAIRLLNERNTILESIGDAFFSLDTNWMVQYWNHVAEKELKTPKEKILGQNIWQVYPDTVKSLSYIKYHKAMSSGKALRFEDYYPPLGKWYDINVYPSSNGLSIFFKDITPRKKAEQELKEQAEALSVSQKRYADLFQLSPLPKFVFDSETLAFLDVNRAAVIHYGYTREEFLKMTLRDIRPASEISKLEDSQKSPMSSSFLYKPGIFTHRKKNGELIKVDITSSGLDYNGRSARIALAMDVTEQLNHLDAIETQNKKLREISWMQSHVIRAPLSRIMGLVELFNNTQCNEKEVAEILAYVKLSANELDDVIKAITKNANERIDSRSSSL
ncbi:PAS domain S-box protein [Mucilaginibacter auburnensis]|uniref:histidine kinase n=1 Tax=Mucilaginibacter auburnensis TaxID=1457233 RepID=A0A2H9VNW5_9SPHI|nr:PAS domain S-box protein [Mucilaginibacter auburnensis]PJJ80034.1 PAS domain S-box-containing protein [Mucilaginibacter auburnensis]